MDAELETKIAEKILEKKDEEDGEGQDLPQGRQAPLQVRQVSLRPHQFVTFYYNWDARMAQGSLPVPAGGEERQGGWYEREIIGFPVGCIDPLDPVQRLLTILETKYKAAVNLGGFGMMANSLSFPRLFHSTSTVTSYVASPQMQTVSFASGNACLPGNIDQIFSIQCV